MQQINFTQNEISHQNQFTLDEQSKKYQVKESNELQQFNPLGLSLYLEANCQQDVIAKQLFSQILKMIEDKLYEIEQRLDNREYLNAQINLLKLPDQYAAQEYNDDLQSDQIKQSIEKNYLGKFSDLSNLDAISPQIEQKFDIDQKSSKKPFRSRSSADRAKTVTIRTDIKNTSNTDELCQKMEQFQNKLWLLTEQMNQISQQESQFEQLINDEIKDSQDRLIQNEQVIKQLYSTNQEITENQREFLTHLSQARQEINYFSSELTRFQQENKMIMQQLEQNYLEIQKQIKENKNEITLQKSCLECIDNDFLVLLKKFKDLYHELAKKKFDSSQQRKPLQ
ncbi:unnamed protein product (macronuclear) [Paramecium tetraurelia]|uniref:Uncharacterized protein n=1 Tax=Paramecium tetraurelia TaxID=5888 RepID=A0CXS0_PARTE|nr:uncharacterized protein GSPATT00011219001 [Paramecium tetraurelia]CAK75587.1 unnamed protein product [Paramecium tetraurelia]|eukprot:XP_001442984.1 hypothetical protein (macronuclear) [Paramecium tetraurelia strain d4-2]